MKPLTVVLPYSGEAHTKRLIDQLRASSLVERICLLGGSGTGEQIPGAEFQAVEAYHGSDALRVIASRLESPYVLLVINNAEIEFGQFGLERMIGVASETQAALVYSDYHDLKGNNRIPHPVIDYQLGSLRDDFDFGSVLMIDSAAFHSAVQDFQSTAYRAAALYALRLAVSRRGLVVRI